ncbi:hypothetical protein GF324_07300, partial [bacterium]|nr:hypothetical protein [bacterium]
ERHDRVIVLKSRQMMVTWIGCAWMLYRTLTGGPGIHLLLSKEERSAKELIQRVRFIWDHLPDEYHDLPVKSSSTALTLPSLDGRLMSLPAAPYAVRGLSPKTVFWDEMAFTPNDDEIWAAVKPAVDSGGALLGVSTPNGPSGVFARLVQGSDEGFLVERFHYSDHPLRQSDDWQAKARAGLSEARWRREQELSFEGGEGAVYDQFEETVHLYEDRCNLFDLRDGSLCLRGLDFGYRTPAVVWARLLPDGSLHIFDALVGSKWPVHQLITEIRAVDARHGLTEEDFAWTAVDPAGAAKHDEGISSVERLHEAGIKAIYRTSSIEAGVEAVRALLRDAAGNVRLRVHKRCTSMVQAFHGYTWDDSGELPLKDGIHDHLMDALRYLVVNLHSVWRRPPGRTPLVRGCPYPD